ncbi:hypothetical protein [Companilactobacillus kimchiensis]|nr:hypothetical protein [Companilactobacillus kimchiensis]
MKKSLILLIPLSIIFSITACSAKNVGISNTKQLSEEQQITLNSKKWNQKTKNLQVSHQPEYSDDFAGSVHSLAGFQKIHSGTWVIKAKVQNLYKVINKKNLSSNIPPVYTRGEIKVDQVIAGTKQLNQKIINLAFWSGITSADNSYIFESGELKKINHSILIQDDNVPLPKIGSEIILSIQNVDWDFYSSNDQFAENGFTKGTTFQPVMATIHFWIKEPGTEKFVLNNSLIKNKQNAVKVPIEQNMTDEINQTYNN